MIFKQYAAKKGALAYLIGDPVTRETVVVDPVPELVEPLLSFMTERGLTLRYILETHLATPQAKGALALQKRTGARIVAHETAVSEHIDIRLHDGDVLNFGEETLRVLHTPGQMPCAVTYWWFDRLFTGETLLATGPGVCHPRGDLARLLQSIQTRLFSFPDEILVYPGREAKGRRLASIEELRRRFGSSGNRGKGRALLNALVNIKVNQPHEQSAKARE